MTSDTKAARRLAIRGIRCSAARSVAAALLLAAGAAAAGCDRTEREAPASRAPETRATRSPDIIGDLGGMPVAMPADVVDSVEHDGDPGWNVRPGWKPPARTQASKLSSLGFDLAYPSLEPVRSGSPAATDRPSIGRATRILVGLNAGEGYPGDGWLDRSAAAIAEFGGPPFRYGEPYPAEHGLSVYTVLGVDPATQRPNREHRDARDIFVHRDASGRVDAYIKCFNVSLGARTCTHRFSLEPAVKIQVYMNYPRTLLPEWRRLQDAAAATIHGFRRRDDASPPTRP